MTTDTSLITVDQARAIAEKYAAHRLSIIFGVNKAPYLREFYSEAPNCWIFYRRKELVMPKMYGLDDCAYCVSKKGALRIVYDFTDDPPKAQAHADTLSRYFETHDR